MENIILERPFEIKCYNKKIIVDNENIVEEASYYCLPQGRSFKTVKIPDGGKFSIPFFIVGYSGGEEDFDKEVEKGINYIREVTREIEEKLISSGAIAIAKIVSTQLDYAKVDGKVVVAEEFQMIGI